MAKVSNKKIKCNINWRRKIVDPYYDLSAADFLDDQTLTENHVYHVILRGREKRGVPVAWLEVPFAEV